MDEDTTVWARIARRFKQDEENYISHLKSRKILSRINSTRILWLKSTTPGQHKSQTNKKW